MYAPLRGIGCGTWSLLPGGLDASANDFRSIRQLAENEVEFRFKERLHICKDA